jgi:hypothetical protein
MNIREYLTLHLKILVRNDIDVNEHQGISNITLKNISKEWYGCKWTLVLLWAQLTKIYLPLPTSVQPISITKTLLIVPTKNERDPPLFTGKLLIKFQNILRNTTQVIIQHRVTIQFSVISSPITQERKKWKSSKMIKDPPLFTGKLLIKFQNILRNTTHVNKRHRLKILFSVISSPITLEQQKWKSSKMKGILLSSPVSC